MTFDPSRLVHPAVLSLKPYQPGKPVSECQREYGLKEVIKLASNENPLGTSEQVYARLTDSFADLARYPDGAAYALKQALSDHWHISADQLLLGNGSEDVLKMLIQAFVWGNAEILVPQYAFMAYKILAQSMGLAIREIPVCDQSFGVDLEGLLAAVKTNTRMIILANPNNPTGSLITQAELAHFLARLPNDVIVICDEAYYEYVLDTTYANTQQLQKAYPNVVITRTFSKAYGLAGLRVGYAIADPQVIALVNRLRQPFNVNHLAQVAATIALQDQDFVKRSVVLNEQGKAQWGAGLAPLASLGVKALPIQGNFILVAVPVAGEILYQGLLTQGIIIRPLTPYALNDYIRISIGLESENAFCLDRLTDILQSVKKEKVA